MQDYQDMDRGNGSTMMAFGLGMLAGAVTALLLAPATGTETRRKLGQFTSQMGDKAKQGLDGAKEFVSDQKDRLVGAVEEGRHAYQRETSGTAASMSGTTPGGTSFSSAPTGTTGARNPSSTGRERM